jgi:hypothetical protein
MNPKTHHPGEAAATNPQPRRPYKAPRLTEFGNVRDFTRGPGGTKADTKAGAFTSG